MRYHAACGNISKDGLEGGKSQKPADTDPFCYCCVLCGIGRPEQVSEGRGRL